MVYFILTTIDYWFLPHHSTATALHQLVDIWLQAADKGKLSAALILDLMVGFDVINHKKMIEKLRRYG
jgi:retron-type reverse transcriptase